MKELAIDIETYSSTDIKAGVHKYVQAKDFTILMLAYSIDNGPVYIIDFATGDKMPLTLLSALEDPNILKTAYNAAFETVCLSQYFGFTVDVKQWSCTMALAAQAGLPFGLDNVAKALRTEEQKNSIGKELIKYFCVPCKPTKVNGMRTRNLPIHDFAKWLDFKEYCCGDVRTEQAVRKQLSWFTVSNFEKDVWALDQKINNKGMMIDLTLVKHAIEIEKIFTRELMEEINSLAGISNGKSAKQVKDYIQAQTGIEIESLNKAAMPEVNKKLQGTKVDHVLKIREKLSRTSIRKFVAMFISVGDDARLRGLFQYYGANRTGRWAGRNVQVHNLKRNDLKDLNFARQLVKENKLNILKLTYDDVGLVLSNLIRTAFIPVPGKRLVVSDYSAIEARIVSWLADENWRLEVFKTHGKIYEASASQMFKVPIDKVSKDLRQKGKIAELALGYQGAVEALKRMGAVTMGVCDAALKKAEAEVRSGLSVYKEWNNEVKMFYIDAELAKLVKMWRNANKKIVKLWYDVNEAAVEAITTGGHINFRHGLAFYMKNKNLIIQLPSGRELVYINARYRADKILYEGMNQTTKQWGWQDTYGGKIIENIVQAIARDVLTVGLKKIDAAGHDIVLHVHDEIVIESDIDCSEQLTALLSEPVEWAKDLPLGAETFIADYYQK